MELEKKRDERLEVAREAIRQLLEERKNKGKHKNEEEEGDLILSRLLSKLESLEKDANAAHLLKGTPDKEAVVSSLASEARDCGTEEVGKDEICKEIRKIKRQNVITHCLLSVMIIITAFWQLSEASLLLTMKEKFSNPVGAVWDMISGPWKGNGKKPQIEAPPHPPIGVPELPHVDLPSGPYTPRGIPNEMISMGS